jgi:hypothetical protein
LAALLVDDHLSITACRASRDRGKAIAHAILIIAGEAIGKVFLVNFRQIARPTRGEKYIPGRGPLKTLQFSEKPLFWRSIAFPI